MLKTRIIPALLLKNDALVKTVKFQNPEYIGDPVNTVRIFNELEVDELIFLDIMASKNKQEPNYKILTKIANECFMPLSYGGGIRSLEHAKAIFDIGFEKVAVNTHAFETPNLITEIATYYGSQAVIASIDVKQGWFGKSTVYTYSGSKNTTIRPVDWAKQVEQLGAGEILLTSIDREGGWGGFDIDLVKLITDAVSIPVIAQGGAGSIEHIGEVVKQSNASAVALGSMVVFQKKGMGVLVNFPDKLLLNEFLYE